MFTWISNTFGQISDAFRRHQLVGYLLFCIGVLLAVLALDQASINRHENAVQKIEHNTARLRQNTIMFCDEIHDLKIIIRNRALAQRSAFQTLAEVTKNLPGKEFQKAHRKFQRAYERTTIVPIKACPPF